MRLFLIVPLALVAAYFSWRDATLAYWRNQAALSYDQGRAPDGIPEWVAKDPEIEVTANEARLVLGTVKPSDYAGIEANAKAALRIDPLNPAAVFELGMVAERRQEGSGLKFFALAERLSRREVPNEIVLEQLAAQKNDIPGAIARVDRIVSVAPNLGAQIFPPMIGALSDETVRQTFMRYVDRPWYTEFLTVAVNGNADAVAASTMIAAARGHLPQATTDGLATALMNRVLTAGDFAAARRFFAAMQPARRAALGQIGFSAVTTDPHLAPLSWILANDEVTTAKLDPPQRGPEQGSRSANVPGRLTVTVGAEQLTQAASRSTLLKPGTYEFMQTLSYDASAPRAGVTWDVVCAGPKPVTVWHQPIAARGQARGQARGGDAASGPVTYRASLTIPAGCEAQSWRLAVIGDTGTTPSQVALSNLALTAR